MKVLLNAAYWPNLQYMMHVIEANEIIIEAEENYQKQSYRNRCRILSANGPLDLIVPIIHLNHKMLTKDVVISYRDKWPQQHWGAIKSAYGNSPYFKFFEDEIQLFYEREFEFLLEYNLAQLKLILKLLRLKKEISFSTEYEKNFSDGTDLRDHIHPKKSDWRNSAEAERLSRSYYQTFSAKWGFVPNLSILDLIFNIGLESLDYLKR